MKKLYTSFLAISLIFSFISANAQAFCNATGNVIIYSNYDGGILRINVDQNIPNLKIGIVSYEDDSVIISGPFIGNITQVIYAGYFNSANINCPPLNVNIKGVYGIPAPLITINFYPPSPLTNPNGWPNILCNYSCSTTTNQGGCNTPDQVVAYFNQQFSTTNANLRYHYTQYNCWAGTYNVSAGGNCCAVPPVGIEEKVSGNISVSPNPSQGQFTVSGLGFEVESIEVYDMLGNLVTSKFSIVNNQTSINIGDKAKGIYLLKITGENSVITKKLVVE